jgi:hypothetical protein
MDVLLRRDSCQSAGRSLRVPRALSRAAGLIAAVRETSWAMPQRVTGRLEGFQTYNDAWQGLPVLPLKRHRSTPRPSPRGASPR